MSLIRKITRAFTGTQPFGVTPQSLTTMDRGWSGRCSGSHASAGEMWLLWPVPARWSDLLSEALWANVSWVGAYLDPCACKRPCLHFVGRLWKLLGLSKLPSTQKVVDDGLWSLILVIIVVVNDQWWLMLVNGFYWLLSLTGLCWYQCRSLKHMLCQIRVGDPGSPLDRQLGWSMTDAIMVSHGQKLAKSWLLTDNELGFSTSAECCRLRSTTIEPLHDTLLTRRSWTLENFTLLLLQRYRSHLSRIARNFRCRQRTQKNSRAAKLSDFNFILWLDSSLSWDWWHQSKSVTNERPYMTIPWVWFHQW